MRNWSEFQLRLEASGGSCTDTAQPALHVDRLLNKWFLRPVLMLMFWYRKSERDSVIGMRHRSGNLDVPGIVIPVWVYDHYLESSTSASARIAGVHELFQRTAKHEHAVAARGAV